MSVYCRHLRKLIQDGAGMGERPLEGMKIVVDAGNGSGGFLPEGFLNLSERIYQTVSILILMECF